MKKLLLILLLLIPSVNAAMLIDEDFEGTGTPSGWFKGNNQDYDYTTYVLAGSESARANGSTSDYSFVDITDKDEIWYKQLIRADEIRDSGGAMNPLILQDSGYNGLASLYVFNDGSVTIDFVTFSSAGSWLEDTDYYLWGHYRKGTGGVWEVWWDTTDDRANADNFLNASISGTAQVGQFLICGAGSTDNILCDNVQIADTDEFGGSPPASDCSYTSGDWRIDSGEVCNVTTTVSLNGNSLYIDNGGVRISSTGKIISYSKILINRVNGFLAKII